MRSEMHKVWKQFHITQKASAMFLVGGIVQFLAAVLISGWGSDQAENWIFWGTLSLCGSLAAEVLWLMLFPLVEEDAHGLEILGKQKGRTRGAIAA